ncbi:MAG: FAD-dependent oxidoreductase [Deltaproteobacteria bacterium]|nr:FAD-dependent oxidoreductase [Deltaproteobacteria bacterium]
MGAPATDLLHPYIGSGTSRPIWLENSGILAHSRLTKDIFAEVCIIGGGISGLTTAYLLCRAGKKVVVIDDRGIGGGESCRSSAHLSNAADATYNRLIKIHGAEYAKLFAESHSKAIDLIEQIAMAEEIECGFQRVDGYYFSPPRSRRGAELVEVEYEALQLLEIPGVAPVKKAPLGNGYTGPAIRYSHQAQMNVLQYLNGLAQKVQRMKGNIFGFTRAVRVEGDEPTVVTTSHGPTITAAEIVVATNAPFLDRFVLHTKQAAFRTYVVAGKVARGVQAPALFWDTEDPYHYVRTYAPHENSEFEWLIVGGEDHKTGRNDDGDLRWERLEKWARSYFPGIKKFDARWSGQIVVPVDGAAFIGRNPRDSEHIYIASGDAGMGLTHGTIAGILISDLILKRENAWVSVYDPSRKPYRALASYTEQNINVMKQYKNYLTSGEVATLDDIEPGSGAILRRGFSKLAVFRELDGTIREFSAICPHLGCLVTWNNAEMSWDCPCHGSRFTARGEVINGPANINLRPDSEME